MTTEQLLAAIDELLADWRTRRDALRVEADNCQGEGWDEEATTYRGEARGVDRCHATLYLRIQQLEAGL